MPSNPSTFSYHLSLSKGDNLDPKHHIVRYVKPGQMQGEEINGGAFLARPTDGNGVSYNWIEYYPDPLETQMNCIRACARLNYAATGKLVKLNIEKTLNEIKNVIGDLKTTVNYNPLDPENGYPADPSHALMTNIPEDGDALAEAIGDLIRDTLIETYPAKG